MRWRKGKRGSKSERVRVREREGGWKRKRRGEMREGKRNGEKEKEKERKEKREERREKQRKAEREKNGERRKGMKRLIRTFHKDF